MMETRSLEGLGKDELEAARQNLIARIYAENSLLSSRTGHLLTIHGFFATALAITGGAAVSGLPSGYVFRFGMSLFGVLLGGAHVLIGKGTLHSIERWSATLARVEDGLHCPAPLQFDANLVADATNIFSVKFIRKVNRAVAVFLPWGLIVFWVGAVLATGFDLTHQPVAPH